MQEHCRWRYNGWQDKATTNCHHYLFELMPYEVVVETDAIKRVLDKMEHLNNRESNTIRQDTVNLNTKIKEWEQE